MAAGSQAYITNFGEEVVRGQPLFVLSLLLRWLAPSLRDAAGVSSWQVRRCSPHHRHLSCSPAS